MILRMRLLDTDARFSHRQVCGPRQTKQTTLTKCTTLEPGDLGVPLDDTDRFAAFRHGQDFACHDSCWGLLRRRSKAIDDRILQRL